MRFARNATSMNHLVAPFSDIVARMVQDLAKERSGERKKNERRCSAKLCEKADSLKALGCVASIMRNSKFNRINDSFSCFFANRYVLLFGNHRLVRFPKIGVAMACTSLLEEWLPTNDGRFVHFDFPDSRTQPLDASFCIKLSTSRLDSSSSSQMTRVHPIPGSLPRYQWYQEGSVFHSRLAAPRLFFIHAITEVRDTPKVRSNPRRLLRSS